MAYITRIGYKHLEAIRSHVSVSLSSMYANQHHLDFSKWVHDQFPDAKFILEQDYFSKSKFNGRGDHQINFLLCAAMDVYESYSKDSDIVSMGRESMVSSSLSKHHEEDSHGSELAGYWEHDQFIIRAGIVASLGALEEFERGALRILYAEHTEETSMFPMPKLRDFKYECKGWKAVKNQANSVDRRRKLFKKFNVQASANELWYSKLAEYRKLRHVFAHGAGAPAVKFQDFMQCQHYVYKSMAHIASEINYAIGLRL
ncbi:hypothetical protein [Vibrio alginolyticus]|uniref:hypothetical protein n=1 Tax=Vibrio alginolyticus TaxID=663 RepID=UPI001BD5D4F5|nr:hypothetical protein [Vibrio alginolyticus]MBT0119881.1 hypothetical protein [Vibrio alginolyticus]